MPHIKLPHIHIDMHKLKSCVKGQLPRLPGAVGKAMMGCLPSAALGAPSFATCVAGNGVVSAARASQHIAVCMG
ncbi:hypothetical protein ONE63_006795 [Megalurothrips usitatus]|uniref:Uncharacterized protein n=1 Tax=Megalurothrips usitatus TaxID=439358 RepID=A0AAV7XQ06_9NEOP|nr:hypothetical protein ONE63_006795 [Megalurothrips usitatus]